MIKKVEVNDLLQIRSLLEEWISDKGELKSEFKKYPNKQQISLSRKKTIR